ncbi:MFS general substrate transporter [Thozetella sp. PMI_491]|nr:MFS general substrate transporter [Thozetella sp. PMI_491]
MFERRGTECTARTGSEASTGSPQCSYLEKAEDCRENIADGVEATPPGRTLRTTRLDGILVVGIPPDDEEFYRSCSDAFRKVVYWKVDWRLMPLLSLLYLVAQIDRTNITNAKIEGLEEALCLTSTRWSLVLSIFYMPSNMLISHLKRPSRYMGLMVVGWGVVMLGHAFVRSFTGLLALRIALGVIEAGFFPGSMFLLASWYMPQQLSFRIALFGAVGYVSGAISGLLAASVARLGGYCGLESWRWIFLVDAIVSIFLGIMCVFLLIDTPQTSGRWLSAQEIRFLEIQRFIKDGGKSSLHDMKRTQWERFRESVHEGREVLGCWRIYIQGLIMVCFGTASWGLKVTLPTITKAMGFRNSAAQLMTCPPYVAAAAVGLMLAYLSDRQYKRLPFILGALSLATVGLIMAFLGRGDVAGNIPLYMTAATIAFMGFAPVTSLVTSWISGNLAPNSRKAIGMALANGLASTSGIAGSFLFYGPETYYRAFGIGLGLTLASLVAAALAGWSYKWANEKKARMTEAEVRERYTDDQLVGLGDKSPLWRYTL